MVICKNLKIKIYSYLKYLFSGEDMNVNKMIAEATGVSMTTVKKILSQSHSENPEEAIKSPSKKRKPNPKIEIDHFTEG